MAKKKIVEEVEEAPVETGIPKVAHEYKRVDLNELRDRVNDLIEIQNNN